MKFEVSFERIYPHSMEKVWRALTDPTAMGQCLMETDFVPEAGRAFKMTCDDGKGGTDTYLCKVLEHDPPNRMRWSWILKGREASIETTVEIRVEPVTSGTRVSITHSGDRDRDTIKGFRSGWPHKLDKLEQHLSRERTT